MRIPSGIQVHEAVGRACPHEGVNSVVGYTVADLQTAARPKSGRGSEPVRVEIDNALGATLPEQGVIDGSPASKTIANLLAVADALTSRSEICAGMQIDGDVMRRRAGRLRLAARLRLLRLRGGR